MTQQEFTSLYQSNPKPISNEEKARDIGKDWDNAECFGVAIDSDIVAEQAALEAMKWKDEQHKQEKQQWIEKACEQLKKNMIGLDMGKYPMYSPDFIDDFRKVMEE